MKQMTHHIPDALIRAYVAGSLPNAFSLVVAAHVSMCDDCRARLEAEENAGGAVLDRMAAPSLSEDDPALAAIMAALDLPEAAPEPEYRGAGIYPAPVMHALKGRRPRWRPLGGGIRQAILDEDNEGASRLLYIPPGVAVPDHGHGGLELTMVLQGSFSDETGRYGVGDVEVADGELEHTPVAGDEAVCICLAATDARLRFNSFIPRLLQPVFRI